MTPERDKLFYACLSQYNSLTLRSSYGFSSNFA
jgi:hypothetical protein